MEHKIKMKKMNVVNTPYDDVFRTMLNDCSSLIIPVINEIFDEHIEIIKRLDSLLEDGSIRAYTRKTIVEMSGKVVDNLAQKYEYVREGVKSVMGGKVLEYEAKQILNEGKKEGRIEGKKEGRIEGKKEGRIEQAKETAQVLKRMGMGEESIAKAVNVSVGVLKEWFDAN